MLLAHMKRHGLTQRKLANGAHVSVSTVNSIIHQSAQPRSGTVIKLLAYLRKYDALLTFEELFPARRAKRRPRKVAA